MQDVTVARLQSTRVQTPPSFKHNVLRESLSVDSQNIPCATRNEEKEGRGHRDTYLEQQEKEKIETEVRNVDRRRITKMYACCPGRPSGGS
jgi:hypothetical protein